MGEATGTASVESPAKNGSSISMWLTLTTGWKGSFPRGACSSALWRLRCEASWSRRSSPFPSRRRCSTPASSSHCTGCWRFRSSTPGKSWASSTSNSPLKSSSNWNAVRATTRFSASLGCTSQRRSLSLAAAGVSQSLSVAVVQYRRRDSGRVSLGILRGRAPERRGPGAFHSCRLGPGRKRQHSICQPGGAHPTLAGSAAHATPVVNQTAARELQTGVILGAASPSVRGGGRGFRLAAAATSSPVSRRRDLRRGHLLPALIGAAIPYLLRLLRRDPQVAAGPVSLAVADMAALLLYFNLAQWIFA